MEERYMLYLFYKMIVESYTEEHIGLHLTKNEKECLNICSCDTLKQLKRKVPI